MITTLSSTDPNSYNTIYTSLYQPQTFLSRVSVNSLVTRSNFLLLHSQDYIIINGEAYFFTGEYCDLTPEGFAELINEFSEKSEVRCTVDYCQRLTFFSPSEFTITDASYNVQLLAGFTTNPLPAQSKQQGDYHIYRVPSVGYYLSTPILYLCSNLGETSFMSNPTDQFDIQSKKILLKVNNTFCPNLTISSFSAGEYSAVIRSNDLTNAEFWLTDANGHDLHLLSPLYIEVQVDPIPDPEPTILVYDPFNYKL